MPSFGEKLRLEREKRAITLEQISQTTKIGTRMLQALEEEKFSQLPGGIFNKGFVRAYARHVGLDEDQAVADYLQASGEAPPPKPGTATESETRLAEPPEPPPAKPLPWGLFAALLLLLALALSLWSRRQQRPEAHPVPPPTTTSPKPMEDRGPSPISESASPTGPGSTIPTPSKPDTKPAAEPTAASSAARNSLPSAAAPVSAAPDEFTVVILAREDSWVTVTADGKIVLGETLVEGNQRAIHGRKEVVVRAGNTGGLDFVFNGKKLPSQGSYGEVKTVTFGSGGLQPNTPQPAAAP